MEICPFDRKFDRSSFSCGKADLDDWLKAKAGQQERVNNTRTFLAVEGLKVIGYYATTAYRLGLDEAAEMYGVGRRRYPIYGQRGFARFEDHDLHLFMPVKNLLATLEAQPG